MPGVLIALGTADELNGPKNGDGMEQVGIFLGGPTEFTERRSLVGDPAPDFQLQDEDGNNVTLKRLTRRGPVLIHFYRGHW